MVYYFVIFTVLSYCLLNLYCFEEYDYNKFPEGELTKPKVLEGNEP